VRSSTAPIQGSPRPGTNSITLGIARPLVSLGCAARLQPGSVPQSAVVLRVQAKKCRPL
jgi:hypothetical protein